MLVDASAYLSESRDRGRLGARATTTSKRTTPCSRSIIRGWVEVNDYMLANSDAARETLQKTHYKQIPLADFKEAIKALEVLFTSAEWRNDVRRRHGDEVAAAGDRFLRRARQHRRTRCRPRSTSIRSSTCRWSRHDRGAARGLRLHRRRRGFGGLRARQPASADRRRVLLLEAGGEAQFWHALAGRLFQTIYDPRFSLAVRRRAAGRTGGRAIVWPRGKVLGGSSSINGLLYIRGQHEDYDDGRDAGARAGATTTCCLLQALGALRSAARTSTTAAAASSASPTCATTIRTARPGSPPPPQPASRATPTSTATRSEGVGRYQLTLRRPLALRRGDGFLRRRAGGQPHRRDRRAWRRACDRARPRRRRRMAAQRRATQQRARRRRSDRRRGRAAIAAAAAALRHRAGGAAARARHRGRRRRARGRRATCRTTTRRA